MKISDLLKKENNNLDFIRIILACLVIIGHAPILNGNSENWHDPIGYFFGFTYSGALAVKLFFFISGLVVTNSFIIKKSSSYFIFSRTFRLIPALLFVLLISSLLIAPLVTKLSFSDYFSNIQVFKYIQNNLFFNTDFALPGVFIDNFYKGAVNGSLWSLHFEVGCYIVLLAIFMLLGKKNKYYLNIPIILIIIDSLLPTRFILGFLGDNSEVYLLPFSFAIGAFFAVNADKLQMNFSIVIGSFLMYFIFKGTAFTHILFIFGSCNLLLFLSYNSLIIKLKPKYDISYGIYLWGFFIQQTIVFYTGHIYVGLHCVIALLICIIFGFISNIFIEKPFITYGKNCYNYYKNKTQYFL